MPELAHTMEGLKALAWVRDHQQDRFELYLRKETLQSQIANLILSTLRDKTGLDEATVAMIKEVVREI